MNSSVYRLFLTICMMTLTALGWSCNTSHNEKNASSSNVAGTGTVTNSVGSVYNVNTGKYDSYTNREKFETASKAAQLATNAIANDANGRAREAPHPISPPSLSTTRTDPSDDIRKRISDECARQQSSSGGRSPLCGEVEKMSDSQWRNLK